MARLSTPPRPTALQPFAQTEHVIAVCRIMLAFSTLALVIVDPTLPSYRRDLAYPVLLVYLGVSLAIFALVRSDAVRRDRMAVGSTAIDIGWIALMTLFTRSVASPFFLLNVFVILSVSVRWGLQVAGPTTVLMAILYPGMIAVGRFFDPDEFPFHRAQFLRPIYLLPIGYLLAYLGEHERRSKAKLAFMLSLALPSGADARIGRSLTRVVRRTLQHFSARYGVVVLHDPESGRYFIWELRRDADRTAMNLRISERDPYPLPFLGPTEGMLVNHFEHTTRSGLCYDVHSGVVTRRPVPSGASVPQAETAVSALVAPIVVMRNELRGRAFLVRDRGRRFNRDDLELLLLLAGQVANTLESRRLQAFAENVAVLEERGRIARDLHDGFIQSLAGIDLRVAACKTWLQRDPTKVPQKLDELHAAVDRGYQEVRRFLEVLRTTSRPPADLGGTLDRLAQDFSNREGVQVRVERPKGLLTLPDTTTHELTQIVREALNNAVRHGKASDVQVKLAAAASGIKLAIRDNGRGFNGASTPDPDGYLPTTDQPWSIRERTDALGGRLRVRSQAGEGAEISISLPITTRREL